MKCPECRSSGARTIDSRDRELGRYRRRECTRCKARWATYEVDEVALEKMKKMGLRSEFMDIAQSELNKAYFRMMEELKKRAIVDESQDSEEYGPPVEVVSFTDRRFKREA